MAVTQNSQQHATPATPGVRLRADVFDRRCEELGATTEVAKAQLVEVDRVSLHRFRKGEMGPRLEVAMRFATRLGVTVEDLFEQVSE